MMVAADDPHSGAPPLPVDWQKSAIEMMITGLPVENKLDIKLGEDGTFEEVLNEIEKHGTRIKLKAREKKGLSNAMDIGELGPSGSGQDNDQAQQEAWPWQGWDQNGEYYPPGLDYAGSMNYGGETNW